MNLPHRITKLASALCAGALLFPNLAWAKVEPLSLARQGAWQVNYDDDSCHLLGAFGLGNDQIIFRLTRYQPGDEFTLTLYGEPLKTSAAYSPIKLAFGDGAPLQAKESMNGKNGTAAMIIVPEIFDVLDRKPSKAKPELPPVTAEQEATVKRLTFQFEGRKPLRLELGSMAAPLKAVRACNADLVKFWGLDPDVQAKLKRRPTPTISPGRWLRSEDYPKALWEKGQIGLVRFRLEVDAAGAVSGCHIQLKMKSTDFDKLSCDLITKRAKFVPALDATGAPVKSYYVNAVRWIL